MGEANRSLDSLDARANVIDCAVPVEHARRAAEQIDGAELMLVGEGHHLLPAGRGFDGVMELQLALSGIQTD